MTSSLVNNLVLDRVDTPELPCCRNIKWRRVDSIAYTSFNVSAVIEHFKWLYFLGYMQTTFDVV